MLQGSSVLAESAMNVPQPHVSLKAQRAIGERGLDHVQSCAVVAELVYDDCHQQEQVVRISRLSVMSGSGHSVLVRNIAALGIRQRGPTAGLAMPRVGFDRLQEAAQRSVTLPTSMSHGSDRHAGIGDVISTSDCELGVPKDPGLLSAIEHREIAVVER